MSAGDEWWGRVQTMERINLARRLYQERDQTSPSLSYRAPFFIFFVAKALIPSSVQLAFIQLFHGIALSC